MTCIVGMIADDTVYIGGDSLGSTRMSKTVREDTKVFRVDDFIFGCTTSFRMIQLLQYELKVPEQKTEQTDHAYMVTTFIDTVRELFKDKGFKRSYEDGQEKGGHFLVGYKGVLYHIEGDYQVGIPSKKFTACGSGGQIALGAMEVFTNELESILPEMKIKRAIEAAAEHVPSVGGPVDIISDTYKPRNNMEVVEDVLNETGGLTEEEIGKVMDSLNSLSEMYIKDD